MRALLCGLQEAPRWWWAVGNSLLAMLCVYDPRKLDGRIYTVAGEAMLVVVSAFGKEVPK